MLCGVFGDGLSVKTVAVLVNVAAFDVTMVTVLVAMSPGERSPKLNVITLSVWAMQLY